MKHVAPELFADAAAGRIGEAMRQRIERHTATCARCAAARARVLTARAAFAEIRATAAPDLRWDHIGARIHWVTSSERRASERRQALPPRRLRWLPALGLAAAAAAMIVAGAVGLGDAGGAWLAAMPVPAVELAPPVVPSASVAIDVAATPPAPSIEAATPTPLAGVVTYAQGEVTVDGSALAFDAPLVAGATVVTGAGGRVAVQIGKDSGFVLAAGSTLALRRFDETAVELVVDGAVSVDLARRAPGQRFIVIAGEHTVEVRGTAFRVEHTGGHLGVTCRHGRVVVSDGARDVAVSAGERLIVDAGMDLAALRPETLTAERLAALVDAVPLLPGWAGPSAAFATSAPLRIGASSAKRVVIDGVAMGAGAMTVRVMAGRHLVEGDEWPRGEWISATGERAAVVAVTPPQSPPKLHSTVEGRARRTAELHADVDVRRIDACLRALRKQGVAEGAYIELDLGIEASGAVSHLNIADTNLPASTAACIRDVVESVTFARGERAEVHERFVF